MVRPTAHDSDDHLDDRTLGMHMTPAYGDLGFPMTTDCAYSEVTVLDRHNVGVRRAAQAEDLCLRCLCLIVQYCMAGLSATIVGD